MTNREIRLISASPLFAGLDPAGVHKVLSFLDASEAECGAGELLHVPGTVLERFAFVLSGQVQVYRDEPDGTRLLMAGNGPGDSFGESLCFLGTDAPVTIIASEKSRLLWLSMEPVKAASAASLGGGEAAEDAEFVHEVTMRVMECFAKRALAMNDRIQVLSQRSLRKKILTLLQQYGRKNPGRTFELPLSREDMAVFLGCDRSALSRELARMKSEGIIDYYKNSFRIADPGAEGENDAK